jgi:hypothetical protein
MKRWDAKAVPPHYNRPARAPNLPGDLTVRHGAQEAFLLRGPGACKELARHGAGFAAHMSGF